MVYADRGCRSCTHISMEVCGDLHDSCLASASLSTCISSVKAWFKDMHGILLASIISMWLCISMNASSTHAITVIVYRLTIP